MKSTLPKGLLFFVCLVTATSVFAMEFELPPRPAVAYAMQTLKAMQLQGNLTLRFRVKSAALVFEGIEDLGKMDTMEHSSVEQTLSSTVIFLGNAAFNQLEGVSVRKDAVDAIASQYLTIRGVDEFLRRLEKRLANRGLGGDYDVAEHVRDVIKEEKLLEEAAIRFGGLVYRFTLSESALK